MENGIELGIEFTLLIYFRGGVFFSDLEEGQLS